MRRAGGWAGIASTRRLLNLETVFVGCQSFMSPALERPTMQAIEVSAYGDSDALEAVEREKPEPGPGEVRIAVEAAGINFADVMQRRGVYPGGPDAPYVP